MDGSDAPDEVLLLAYGQGDSHAARELTRRLVPRMLGYATRLLGGDRGEAEDVTQEAMLRLWRAAPGWRMGEAKVTTWLYPVVTNLCTDRLRRRKRQGEWPDDEPDDGKPAVEQDMQHTERLSALDRALADLPDRQRQAVILRHIEGLTNPEIAVVMEIGIEAVESLTARGKRALAAALAGRKEELGYEN